VPAIIVLVTTPLAWMPLTAGVHSGVWMLTVGVPPVDPEAFDPLLANTPTTGFGEIRAMRPPPPPPPG
jgi:hypothetical protein